MSSDGSLSLPRVDGFVVVREVGRGGFSTVYAARQEEFNRDVAIKVLHVDGSDQRRFVRECHALGPLTGIPGIVPVLGAAVTSEGRPCIVMPLMTGRSLADRLREGERYDVDTVVRWGVELATGLAIAHDLGIHHRDVKPENVLIGPAGNVALSDFGIASIQSMQNASQTIASLSPPYAPPERFQPDAIPEDPVASDVYSLSATLHALLAGNPPFGTVDDGGILGLLHRITDDPLPALERTDTPPQLHGVLATAMAKNPSDRYRDARSFADALTLATDTRGVPTPTVTTDRIIDPQPTAGNTPEPEPTIAAASTRRANDTYTGATVINQRMGSTETTLTDTTPNRPNTTAGSGEDEKIALLTLAGFLLTGVAVVAAAIGIGFLLWDRGDETAGAAEAAVTTSDPAATAATAPPPVGDARIRLANLFSPTEEWGPALDVYAAAPSEAFDATTATKLFENAGFATVTDYAAGIPPGTYDFVVVPAGFPATADNVVSTTSGVEVPAGKQITLVADRESTSATDLKLTPLIESDLRNREPGKASVTAYHGIPLAAADGVRVGAEGAGCLVDGTPLNFGDKAVVEVDPGSYAFGVFAPDDTTCGGTPLIGPAELAVEAGQSYIVFAWGNSPDSLNLLETIIIRYP